MRRCAQFVNGKAAVKRPETYSALHRQKRQSICWPSTSTGVYIGRIGGSRNFEKGGRAEHNVSATSSFIAKTHNELYTKNSEPVGGAAAPTAPLNPLLIGGLRRTSLTNFTSRLTLRPVGMSPLCLPLRRRLSSAQVLTIDDRAFFQSLLPGCGTYSVEQHVGAVTDCF